MTTNTTALAGAGIADYPSVTLSGAYPILDGPLHRDLTRDAAALACLARHDALDVAWMLGLDGGADR